MKLRFREAQAAFYASVATICFDWSCAPILQLFACNAAAHSIKNPFSLTKSRKSSDNLDSAVSASFIAIDRVAVAFGPVNSVDFLVEKLDLAASRASLSH